MQFHISPSIHKNLVLKKNVLQEIEMHEVTLTIFININIKITNIKNIRKITKL